MAALIFFAAERKSLSRFLVRNVPRFLLVLSFNIILRIPCFA